MIKKRFPSIIYFLPVLAWLPLLACVSTPQPDRETLAIRSGTVKIMVTSIRPSYYVPWRWLNYNTGRGSGAIIAGRRIITNAHVVADATLLQVQKESDPRLYNARVEYIAHECDLALLSIAEEEEDAFFRDTTTLAFSERIPEMKSTVATYGFPVGGRRISITEGVVSRIEMHVYVHSNWLSLLAVQTDAAINPGNSGGPVIQQGRIVGIAFQGIDADNIGYMIPIPVIQRFLADVADGQHEGIPLLGIYWANLENAAFREYLGLGDERQGIHINGILKGGSADGYLQPGDVVLAIDGIAVANDGSIPFGAGRISFSHLINTKQVGESITITLWRDRQELDLSLPMRQPPQRITLHEEYESLPRYFIFGGFIFQPLSREYLESWNEWWNNADPLMLYYFYFHALDDLFPEREEFVIINQVLPDPINTYVSSTQYEVVDSINGFAIHRLEDVIEAVQHPQGGYHVIRVDGNHKPLILEAAGMEAANARILRNYGIPADRRLQKEGGYYQ